MASVPVWCVSIRFSTVRSADLSSEAAERHDIISKDPQWRVREERFLSALSEFVWRNKSAKVEKIHTRVTK